MKTTRQQIFHSGLSDMQKERLPTAHGNSHNHFGTVIKKHGDNGWVVSWDTFPDGQKEVPMFRGKITFVQAEEEEKDYDRDPGILEQVLGLMSLAVDGTWTGYSRLSEWSMSATSEK